MTFTERWTAFRAKYERLFPLAFFAAGFCFDAHMLKRIDEPLAMAQQAVYIALSGTLICLNMVKFAPRPAWAVKLWHFHEELLHFLLGTLLNAYTIFYFKAASAFTSIVFVVCLCGLLYVNESKRLREKNAAVRLVLFTLCLTSYLICVVPIALSHLGPGPFVLALVAAVVCAFPMFWFLKRHGLEKQMYAPFSATLLAFLVLYFAELIPPVPLSLNFMGVYHGLKKENGAYLLESTRSRWRFWQSGDQSFAARPGDKIYFFVRVFSPTNFSENLNVRWLRHDEQGWRAWDAIALAITGGREEGFRGYAVKSNYEPGEWRVQVETHDKRELGRIYFTVTADDSTDNREIHVDLQ